MSMTEHRLPLDSSNLEFLVHAKFQVNEADPGVVKRTYCTLDYLMEHLQDKAEVTRTKCWRGGRPSSPRLMPPWPDLPD